MGTRRYASPRRTAGKEETRKRVLRAAGRLFRARGLEAVTVAEIAAAAGVGASTVYAAYASKEGILKVLFEGVLFGPRFQEQVAALGRVTDPVEAVAATAGVACAIYESEAEALGGLREKAVTSRALHEVDREFERIRLEMQRPRLEALFAAGLAGEGLDLDAARRIMWMYSSRAVHRMLAVEAGWGPARYTRWLERTLVDALVGEAAARRWRASRPPRAR